MSLYFLIYTVLDFIFDAIEYVLKVFGIDVLQNPLLRSLPAIVDHRPKEDNGTDSVNRNELEHLGKMVDFWWDPDGRAKMLHTFHQVRVPLLIDGLIETGVIDKSKIGQPDVLKGVRILEAGCGGGVLAEDLAKLGATVVGIDPGQEMLALAREHLKTKSPQLSNLIEYHCETVEEHVKQNASSYDAVFCSEVMEHVDAKIPILDACARCLKPGGSFFITTESQTLLAWFVFIIIPEYVLKFIPRYTHFYEKFITPQRVSKYLDQLHCQTIRIRGTFYDRLNNCWSFIKEPKVNYGLHAVRK